MDFKDKNLKIFVKERFQNQFGSKDFNKHWNQYLELKDFAPDENVEVVESNLDDKTHFIMRICTQYYLTQAFKAMKIDLKNHNVEEDLNDGNIGTPGRIAKVWCGFDTHDDTELGCGRWSKKPRIATFDNTHKKAFPITKKIDIISNCSHHNIVFSTKYSDESYAIVSYVPDKFVLGISKLQRLADWLSRRFWLQEDLTKALYEEISNVAETESVYVKLVNVIHGCEYFRGAQSQDGSFTSEYYGGMYEDEHFRNSINN